MASRPPAATGRRENIADFRVTLDGKDLTATIRPRLVSLTLSEKRGGEADQLDLVIDDTDRKMAIPKKGVVIRVQLGWKQGTDVIVGLVDKGRFTVDEASHAGPPDQITVRARSADMTGSYRARREHSWRDTTLGAVLGEIAGRNGLTMSCSAELSAIEIPVLEQHERSDMALVRELGRRHGAIATVKDRRLLFSAIGSKTTPKGTAIPPAAVTRTDRDRHDYRVIDRDQDAPVEARWHDQKTATRKTVKVGSGTREPVRVRRVHHSEADAKNAAEARQRRNARAAAEMDLDLALGRPDLYPDRRMAVAGIKPEIDAQDWLIAEASHYLDKQGGLKTKLKLECRSNTVQV